MSTRAIERGGSSLTSWALLGLLLPACLLACVPEARLLLDADGDGAPVYSDGTGDCDDADPSVHPGAPELCDGRDNSCNGLVDEGFADEDQDGILNCLDTETCDGTDNDGDGLVDEGSPDTDKDGDADCIDLETCDGTDNNGDGRIDEGFVDTDQDHVADCVDTDDCITDTDRDGTPDCLDKEVCDGLDNDGDGQVDEGSKDTDQDGVKDCVDLETCDGLDNDGDGVADNGLEDLDNDGKADCLNIEICDGLDNDGDGGIDEGFDVDWKGGSDCIDNDGDSYTEYSGDCDDSSSLASPSFLYELAGDTVDNDCDGAIDEVNTLSTESSVSAGAPAGSGVGTSLLMIDLDGDGAPERLIGAPGDGTVPQAGRIFLERGTGSLPSSGSLLNALVLTRGQSGDRLGQVQAVGLSRTGAPLMLAAGAPAADSGRGQVVIWPLGGSLTALPGLTPVVIQGLGGTDALGSSLAFVGDLDGDDVPELAVGAPGAYAETGQGYVQAGMVAVFSGASLLAGVPISPSNALNLLPGLDAGSRFGASICSPGDWDGDGLAELVTGAPGAAAAGVAGAGQIRIQYGQTLLSCAASSCSLALYGATEGEALGTVVGCPGDVMGEGLSLWVGAGFPIFDPTVPEYLAHFRAFRGGAPSVLDPDANGVVDPLDRLAECSSVLTGAPTASILGHADVTADGLPELFLGLPSYASRTELEGQGGVWIFDWFRLLGADSMGDALLIFVGDQPGRLLGASSGGGHLTTKAGVSMAFGAPGLEGGAVWYLPALSVDVTP